MNKKKNPANKGKTNKSKPKNSSNNNNNNRKNNSAHLRYKVYLLLVLFVWWENACKQGA